MTLPYDSRELLTFTLAWLIRMVISLSNDRETPCAVPTYTIDNKHPADLQKTFPFLELGCFVLKNCAVYFPVRAVKGSRVWQRTASFEDSS